MKKIVLLIALLVSPMVATFGNLSNPSTDLGKEIAKLLKTRHPPCGRRDHGNRDVHHERKR